VTKRPFSDDEYDQRLLSIQQTMEAEGLDALLAYQQESINYLTGYSSQGYFAYQCLIVPREGEMTLMVRQPDFAYAQDQTGLPDVRMWLEDRTDGPTETVRILRERGLGQAALGIEKTALPLSVVMYEQLSDQLDRLVDGSHILANQRLIKSDEEIRLMREAARLASAGCSAVVDSLRPGMTEFEISAELEYAIRKMGSEWSAIAALCTANPRWWGRGTPTARRVELGDLLQIEFAPCAQRYHVLSMRTIRVGDPPPLTDELHDAVAAAIEAEIEALRVGATFGSVDVARRAALKERGMLDVAALPHAGTGIGLGFPPTGTESLALVEGDERLLKAGMTFHLQPGINDLDRGISYSIGDTVLVTDGGAENLTGDIPWKLSWEAS
jgi:Xaa-Pro dipeptidase